jgi:hypothetical protein
VDTKRLVVGAICLAVLVGGYFVIKSALTNQIEFAQKQLGDPSQFASTPAPPPRPTAPAAAPAASKEYDVWFRVSGSTPEAKVTYTDATGEKGGVVVQVPWQISGSARDGNSVSLVVDNQTSKDVVAEIFLVERSRAASSDGPPSGALPWQRASAGSFGIARCEGTVGR